MDEPKFTISLPKRWLQFRLRTLLVLTLASAIAMTITVKLRNSAPARLAFDGHCPVTLVARNAWLQGASTHSANFEGLTYYFVGPREQKLFTADPAKYSLAVSGHDVVMAKDGGRLERGQRRYGYRYSGKLFLFSSQASMNTFAAAPKVYSSFADAWAHER